MSQSVAVLGSNQVPLTYTVPVPGTLTPLTASAVFDGSGAGGAFIPCVSMYDSDGNLIARATAPEVAQGSAAEVSWFPGVGLGAAASAGVLPVAAGRVNPGTPTTVTAGSTVQIPWFEVNISDPSQFGWSSSPFPQTLTLTNGGLVFYSLTVMPWVDWPLSADGNIRFWGHSGDDDVLETGSIFASYTPVDVFSDQASGPWPVTINGIPAPSDLGGSETWQASVQNNTSSDWQFGDGTHFTVMRISDWIAD